MTSAGKHTDHASVASRVFDRTGSRGMIDLANVPKGYHVTDALLRIKRLILAQRVVFTAKAEAEMYADGLSHAIVNAPAITKRLRSRNPWSGRRETLYVIKGITYDGVVIYTKGKIATFEGWEVFYVLISSKRSTDG